MTRRERQQALRSILGEDPFLTDEGLARRFRVSVQTVRLDRLALGIPELRSRTQAVARRSLGAVRAVPRGALVGQLVSLDVGLEAVSTLDVGAEMALQPTGMVRGHTLFGQAETLALSLADADQALVDLVNVKFKRPARVGERLVARAEVVRRRMDGSLVVLVVTRSGDEPVFRGKFVVTALAPAIPGPEPEPERGAEPAPVLGVTARAVLPREAAGGTRQPLIPREAAGRTRQPLIPREAAGRTRQPLIPREAAGRTRSKSEGS